MKDKFDDIAIGLKSGDYVASLDINVFKKWSDKKMSLEECLFHFKRNNGINYDIKLNHFCRWLLSLGYRR